MSEHIDNCWCIKCLSLDAKPQPPADPPAPAQETPEQMTESDKASEVEA